MKSFEDFGFACLDNVPPVLAPAFVDLVRASDRDTAALAFDVRSGGAFGDATATLEHLLNEGLQPEVLFLDADDETLVRRYSETRRRHPLHGTATTLIEAIAAERASLAALRERADYLWDTTNFTQAMLKDHIAATFVGNGARHTRTTVIAFGFKYGVPLDADWTFDVRFLPNPHYQLDAPAAQRERSPKSSPISRPRPISNRFSNGCSRWSISSCRAHAPKGSRN